MSGGREVKGDVQWECSRELNDSEWDGFVVSSANGHHEQTTAWARVKAAYGWTPVRIIARSHGKIIAGAQILEKRAAQVMKVGYLARGPILNSYKDGLSALVVQYLDSWARQSYTYIVVDLPYSGREIEACFREIGFQANRYRLPPTNSFDTTTYIDLAEELEQIFRRIGASKRNKLRQSFRTDLRLRRGGAGDVALFQKLMWELCELRGSRPNPPQRDFFERLWKEFPAGQVQIFVLENAVEPISAIFAFRTGEWLRCWKVGSSRKDKGKHPNERMWWEAIQMARAEGVRWFDFVWVERETAIRLQHGEKKSPNWTPESMTTFKMEFGGNLLLMPSQMVKIYSPLLRLLVKAARSTAFSTMFPKLRIAK